MNRHYDFLGYEISIGSKVVYMSVGMRSLSRGTVTSLGKTKATIVTKNSHNQCKTWQTYDQLVKIRV